VQAASSPRIFLRDVLQREILRACFVTSRSSTDYALAFRPPDQHLVG
jgi:hypothetical protein